MTEISQYTIPHDLSISNGLLNDKEIKHYVDHESMITPFIAEQVKYDGIRKIPSYGLSSMGYDIRLQRSFKIFQNRPRYEEVWTRLGKVMNERPSIIDPLDQKEVDYIDEIGDSCLLPPHSYCLSPTVEYFKMPNNVGAQCLGKSTWARLGVLVNCTPLEIGWTGTLVVEVANLTDSFVRVHANVGIAQLMFFKINKPEVSYGDRNGGQGGKYQGQLGITLSKV